MRVPYPDVEVEVVLTIANGYALCSRLGLLLCLAKQLLTRGANHEDEQGKSEPLALALVQKIAVLWNVG
jgi:hypothetical protein